MRWRGKSGVLNTGALPAVNIFCCHRHFRVLGIASLHIVLFRLSQPIVSWTRDYAILPPQ